MTVFKLSNIIVDMEVCATAAGFCTFKFGKPENINFDHNICYDLLNVDYPTSTVVSGNREVHTFRAILARTVSKSNTTGVQTLDDVHITMSLLEAKMWNLLSCLSLGGGGGDCKDTIPKSQIRIVRDKGLFNDNLVTLQVQFDMVTPLGGGSTDPCGPCGGFYDDEYTEPCPDPCTDPVTFPSAETAGP